MKWVKGTKYMVADGNWTLGGKHTTEYTDVKLQCTPENYIIVLTNVTPINLIKKIKSINQFLSTWNHYRGTHHINLSSAWFTLH